MRQVGRRGLVALGLVLALAPLSAYAEDGNQAAIDAAKAEKAWLQSLPVMDQGVALGQLEIANAKAIARMLWNDAHAQTEIPNSMEQYNAFCAMAIQHMQAKVANASAMVSGQPFNLHAQAELANANAQMRTLWTMIGDTYPGNPYYASGTQVQSPSQVPLVGDEQLMADDEVLTADEAIMAAIDDETIVTATYDENLVGEGDVRDSLAD